MYIILQPDFSLCSICCWLFCFLRILLRIIQTGMWTWSCYRKVFSEPSLCTRAVLFVPFLVSMVQEPFWPSTVLVKVAQVTFIGVFSSWHVALLIVGISLQFISTVSTPALFFVLFLYLYLCSDLGSPVTTRAWPSADQAASNPSAASARPKVSAPTELADGVALPSSALQAYQMPSVSATFMSQLGASRPDADDDDDYDA